MLCPKCGREYAPGEEPDPCIGRLEGVSQACCGHGKQHKAYVQFDNGILFRGFRIEYFGQSRLERRGG